MGQRTHRGKLVAESPQKYRRELARRTRATTMPHAWLKINCGRLGRPLHEGIVMSASDAEHNNAQVEGSKSRRTAALPDGVHRSITVAEAGEHAGAIWRLLWRERGRSDARDCRE